MVQSFLRRKVAMVLRVIVCAFSSMYVSPKMTILIIKYGTMYLAIWPLESKKRYWNVVFNYLWWFYIVNNVLVIVPTVVAMYISRRDITAAMVSWLELLALFEAFVILLNFKYYKPSMQTMLEEAINYINTADVRRQLYLEEKAAAITITFVIIIILYTAVVIIYVCRPALTEWDGMITTAYYPPSMRLPFVNAFIYASQLTALVHNTVLFVSDAFAVLLLYVCTVRLKVLQRNFQSVSDYDELKRWICEHDKILCLVKKTNSVVRVNISKSVISFIGYSVGAGLQIISPAMTIVSFQQYALVITINALRLFINAIFADDLGNRSKSLINTIYSTIWYKDNRDVKIGKIMIMLRCQKLLRISVSGIMPALGIPYLTRILYTSISYFMTLRAITGN